MLAFGSKDSSLNDSCGPGLPPGSACTTLFRVVVASMEGKPAGSLSSTLTPNAVTTPVFFTSMVYCKLSPSSAVVLLAILLTNSMGLSWVLNSTGVKLGGVAPGVAGKTAELAELPCASAPVGATGVAAPPLTAL